MRKIGKIGFSPYKHKANLFVSLSESAIEEAGYDVCNGSMKNIFGYDCVILNWFETLPKNKAERIKNYIAKRIFLSLCKIKGIKVVAIFHNRKPHGAVNDKLQSKMITKLFESVDKIIILSKQSVEYLGELSANPLKQKCFYIPHPNYIGAYGPLVTEQEQIESKMKLLFFGGISPYKNIELIIEVARKLKNKKIEFWIVGKPESIEYRSELEKLSAGLGNVVCKFGFVNDEDIPRYMNMCDALILPYDESTLNSGTVLLAFSYQRTVICPKIAMVEDFENEDMYIYDYTSEDGQLYSLLNKVECAYMDFIKDRYSLKRKGENLFLYTQDKCGISTISKLYKELFEDLERTSEE